MTDVLNQIREDHTNLAKLLDAVERELDRAVKDKEPDYEIIEGVVDYCLNYPDLYHHPLEDLIVRRLSERTPDAAPAVAGLEAEHKALADTTRRFNAKLQEVLLDLEVTRDDFHDMARDFVRRYRDHMRKEEETFLPAAARSLTPGDLADIETQIEGRGDPLFGTEQSARYDALRKKILRWSKEAR